MGSQLMIQITGVLAVVGYTAGMTFIILKIIDVVIGLRVAPDEETEGLDINQHNARGYDL